MKKALISILAVILLLTCLTGCTPAARPSGDPEQPEYYADKRIGVLSGSIHEKLVTKQYPNATVTYYNSDADMATALSNGIIDAFSIGKVSAQDITRNLPGLTYIDTALGSVPCSMAFSKTDHGKALCAQMNEFIKKLHQDSTWEQIEENWLGDSPKEQPIDMSGLPKDGPVLEFATSSAIPPYSYMLNGNPSGVDVDIAVRFCREYGYGLNINTITFASILPGLAAEKYDFAGDSIVITEERRENALFADEMYGLDIVLVIQKPEQTGDDALLEKYADKRIGALAGSVHEGIVAEHMPDAEVFYYNNDSDLVTALTSGQVDCFCAGLGNAIDAVRNIPGLSYIRTPLDSLPCALAFSKDASGNELMRQMNEFTAKLNADGIMEKIVSEWVSDDAVLKPVDTSDLSKTGRVLTFATTGLSSPYSCLIDGEPSGLDVDLAVRFCREYGYGIDIQIMDWTAILPGLSSGKYDFAGNCIVITEERKETINLSDPCYHTPFVLVTNKADPSAGTGSFWESLKSSFEKTFLREERWKMIVDGLVTTIVITALSVIFGSLIGFGIYMLRRTGKKIAAGFSTVFIRLLQGTPIVVLLMILFYIVFAHTGLSGMFVAVVGFSLNFAAYVSEILRSGIDAVDKGQTEAALASGFTKPQAFFKIVFPQAAINFLPVYRGEIISMLKSTSIVGYIAIQDLTKVSDLIRSRTYEPFFPLIVTAIIYFLLSTLLALLLQKLERRCKPNRKNRKVKGVEQK